MSGPDTSFGPRHLGRGAALSLVLAGVLAAGAAGGAWGGDLGQDNRAKAAPAGEPGAVRPRSADGPAAREAMEKGFSPAEAARREVSRSGDRWASVYSEKDYAEFTRALSGEYTGVGVDVSQGRSGRLRIARVQPGSPAERVGVREGDLLRRVDGRSVDGSPVTDVVARLRGDEGDARKKAPVDLSLERDDRTWTVSPRRTVLRTSPVTVERAGPRKDVVIKVGEFTEGAGERVREAVRQAPAEAGVLLDLRGNPGGLVTEATKAASAFLDGGLVATYDVHGEQRVLHAQRGGDTRRPVVALVDGGTMSAAELLVGALQDRGRAVVVGSRTFGKGSVQMPTELADGSVAELTVGHYRTPSGRAVDDKGIVPDLEVRDGAEKRAARVLSGLGSPS